MAAVIFERLVVRFTSCCDDTVYLEYLYDDKTDYGTLVKPTTLYPGFSDTCYKVTIYSTPNWIGLGSAPVLSYFTVITSETEPDCADYDEECPDCQTKCYTLYNCDGQYFNSTDSNLEPYLNNYVAIVVNAEQSTWFVLENTGSCNDPFNAFTIDNVIPEPCPCTCYDVTGQFKSIVYLDCNGVLQETVGETLRFCSQILPIVNGNADNYQIKDNGTCTDGECPIFCYQLTNCDTGEVIYSTLQNLSQYVDTNTVVQIAGYDGCWSVAISEKICDCTVNITVIQEYSSCSECLPVVAYKLTSCENSSDIKYTYDDLSEYVNQYVKADCGCYLVELITYQPPSVTSIVIITSFKSCKECLRQYYVLINCDQSQDSVYTYTDLSTYLGQVIRIKECGDACYSVEETDIPINPGIVTVTASFKACQGCAPVIPCKCNRITNYDTVQKTYTYIDCNDLEQTIILQPGQSSGKLCLKVWTLSYPETDNLEIFGECTDTQDPKFNWECPETRPKRKIKPGYSVPTCDIEKWEKITCKSSEILYKEVMRLRYGLSNCCPDEDDKWLIKKELIDLAALVDPDYVCTPVQSCGCPPSSCGCGCSSTLKSCSSQ